MDKRKEIINNLKLYFEEKKDEYKLEAVFLYGSWNKGFPRKDSDIDIGIFFLDSSLSDDEIFSYINNISLHLSSKIKYEINVVPIYEDFRKPMLYYNIIILGEPLYIRNFEKYIYIKNQAIYHMEDFSIFGIKWQFDIAKRNMREISNARI